MPRPSVIGAAATMCLVVGCGLEEHPRPAATPVSVSPPPAASDGGAPQLTPVPDAAVLGPTAPSPDAASVTRPTDGPPPPPIADAAPASGITIHLNGVKVPAGNGLVF